MTHPVRIGIVLRFKNPQPWRIGWEQLYREHLEYAAAVDALGFDGIWVAEHHCMDSGYNPTPFVSLAALAGVTKKCWLGTQPLIMPLHNPVLAAEQAAVVDVLSGGRLILGLGAGYVDADFEAIGIDRKERGGRSEEALGVITRALRGEQFDFQGRFYKLKGVKLSPPPLQANMGFQLAVRSIPAAKRAIRHGVDVNLQSREETLVNGRILAEEAALAARDPATIAASVQRGGFIGRTREEAARESKPYLLFQAREYLENAKGDPQIEQQARAMIAAVEAGKGTFCAAEWVEAIEGDAAAISSTGLRPDWINLTLWHAGAPLGPAIEALETFASEVLPHINRAPSVSASR
jgi:alkanesulfonate monooxygenase SsuD/methylene tetrahydromethanopterin reductase-like flavin-dependent oxidoreductase (luciferase family)